MKEGPKTHSTPTVASEHARLSCGMSSVLVPPGLRSQFFASAYSNFLESGCLAIFSVAVVVFQQQQALCNSDAELLLAPPPWTTMMMMRRRRTTTTSA